MYAPVPSINAMVPPAPAWRTSMPMGPYVVSVEPMPCPAPASQMEANWEERGMQISELMKLFHLCCKKGLYKEAEKIARTANDIYPENPAAEAAIYVAQALAKNAKHHTTKHGVKPQTLQTSKGCSSCCPDCCSGGCKNGNPTPVKDYVIDETVEVQVSHGSDSAMPKILSTKEICRRLSNPVSVCFKDMELTQAMKDLQAMTGISIVLDTPALAGAGVSLEQHVSLKLECVSLKTVLTTVLEQVHLTYCIKDGAVVIVSAD
jgi:hypothetical protein